MGISEAFPHFFATGSSNSSTWKLSHHFPTLSLEHLSLSLDPTESCTPYLDYLDPKYLGT
jgi:hypothetical protein